ncbi:hypothetical protein DPMN_059948 [Dreissena polymorpha]|uniref:Uncharacterized protein n=1 Tax=Dreissena polymorpha TaxID=45954 RepID=A0A9D4HH38_DREPO|nr:hypothetical protein DPMN_059948 [Dreissena polymorpha]
MPRIAATSRAEKLKQPSAEKYSSEVESTGASSSVPMPLVTATSRELRSCHSLQMLNLKLVHTYRKLPSHRQASSSSCCS